MLSIFTQLDLSCTLRGLVFGLGVFVLRLRWLWGFHPRASLGPVFRGLAGGFVGVCVSGFVAVLVPVGQKFDSLIIRFLYTLVPI